MQDWLADLLDPPSTGLGERRLTVKPHARARRRFKTMASEIQHMHDIVAAMKRGAGTNEAIDEAMGLPDLEGYAAGIRAIAGRPGG